MDSEISYHSNPASLFSISKHLSKKFGIYLVGNILKITALAKTSDDKYLLAGDQTGVISVYNLNKNYLKVIFEGHNSLISILKLSAKEDFFVSAERCTNIKIWDLASNSLKSSLKSSTFLIDSLQIVKNDDYLVVLDMMSMIEIWNITSSSRNKVIKGAGHLKSITLTSDENSILISRGSYISVYDFEAKQEIKTIKRADFNKFSIILLAPDNKRLFAGTKYDGVELYDYESSQFLKVLPINWNEFSFMKFTENKEIIIAYDEEYIRLWDIDRIELVNVFQIYQCEFASVILTKNKRLLFARTNESGFKVWDVENKAFFDEIEDSRNLLVSSDGSFTIVSYLDNSTAICSIDGQTKKRVIRGNFSNINAVLYKNDQWVFVSGNSRIVQWDLKNMSKRDICDKNMDCGSLAIVKEKYLIACSKNRCLSFTFLVDKQAH